MPCTLSQERDPHPECAFPPSQGTAYYVQVSAYNMKGWGPPQASVPPFAIPSSKYSCGIGVGWARELLGWGVMAPGAGAELGVVFRVCRWVLGPTRLLCLVAGVQGSYTEPFGGFCLWELCQILIFQPKISLAAW